MSCWRDSTWRHRRHRRNGSALRHQPPALRTAFSRRHRHVSKLFARIARFQGLVYSLLSTDVFEWAAAPASGCASSRIEPPRPASGQPAEQGASTGREKSTRALNAHLAGPLPPFASSHLDNQDERPLPLKTATERTMAESGTDVIQG